MMNIDTGITSEVLTIKSETKLIDIINNIISKKSEAIYDYVESLNIDKSSKIIVNGTYFTGVGIVKKKKKKYDNIILVDIYPHLEDQNNVKFTSNLDFIYSGSIVIDTTGFGGISVDESSRLDVDGFIIEDPVTEDNDRLLEEKNNIHERLNAVKSPNKLILKTKGINSKTSGTMTLTIGVLTNLLNKCQKEEGVLYCACEIGFLEEVIFKEKNISKFIDLIKVPALKISTIKPFDLDELILEEIDKINSEMI